jgi:hypothetical protein
VIAVLLAGWWLLPALIVGCSVSWRLNQLHQLGRRNIRTEAG